jgi:hypothetical protein
VCVTYYDNDKDAYPAIIDRFKGFESWELSISDRVEVVAYCYEYRKSHK